MAIEKNQQQELVEQFVETQFNKAEQNWDLIRKFGVKAFQDMLNERLKGQGQTTQLTSKDALEMMNHIPGLDNAIDNTLGLNEIDRFMAQVHTPRADTRPEAQIGDTPRATSNLVANPRLAKLDESINPRARERAFNTAAEAIANNPNSPNEWLPALELALKAHHKLRMAQQLKPRLEPDYKPATPRLTK